jgi:hypothetical protein
MYLLDMHSQTACSVQPTGTHVTFEMFGLLVLHEDFLIFKLPFTVPAPWADDLLILFLCHFVDESP